MPLIQNNKYENPPFLFNGHMQTIFPGLFRKQVFLPFNRERIDTADGDFLDLDWLRNGSSKLVIISHGLEGNSRRPYMCGMASLFYSQGYDVLNWNFRGCSEEMNHAPIFYHSGATYDLDKVIQHAAPKYREVYLIGFSLGGNLTLKYLGEPLVKPQNLKKVVAISAPVHLKSACNKISTRENIIYSRRFLKTLKEKILRKAVKYPGTINTGPLSSIKTLKDFDNIYTGPLHGFKDADHYYESCSSLFFLESIQVPTLILSAQNDPFLSRECFPSELGQKLDKIYMEFPQFGGHVGFSPRKRKEIYWSEKRAFEFISWDE